jgi:hypothetical protein
VKSREEIKPPPPTMLTNMYTDLSSPVLFSGAKLLRWFATLGQPTDQDSPVATSGGGPSRVSAHREDHNRKSSPRLGYTKLDCGVGLVVSQEAPPVTGLPNSKAPKPRLSG